MPGVYGKALSASDDLHRAPGTTVDAAVRRHRNVFDFAEAGVGGTTTPLVAARLREGVALESIKIGSSVNVSAVNISVGTAANPTKYSAAAAGPNATRSERVVPTTALDDDALAAPEEVILTPSAAWPSTGILVSDVFVSKR